MRKSILILSALALSAGVASADRGREHGGGQQHWNGGNRAPAQQHWNGGSRSWSGGVNVTDRGRGFENRRFENHERFENRRPVIVNNYNRGYGYNRGYSNGYNRPYVARHPIYVQRSYPRFRYYNYYQRPQLIVENYAPMAGYIWITGEWTWDGYQWNWIAGHYEPDQSYDYGYDSGY